jgi:succinate dehydrogenase / fumarate reductase, membrane anchor subunit
MAREIRPVSRPQTPDDRGPRDAPPFVGQVVSGVALLLLLGLHMIAQHFIVPTGLRYYADVIEWLRNPVMIVLEVTFLVVVTYHALVGVRSILFDFGFSERTERLITNLLWAVGLVTVVYGMALFAAILNAG